MSVEAHIEKIKKEFAISDEVYQQAYSLITGDRTQAVARNVVEKTIISDAHSMQYEALNRAYLIKNRQDLKNYHDYMDGETIEGYTRIDYITTAARNQKFACFMRNLEREMQEEGCEIYLDAPADNLVDVADSVSVQLAAAFKGANR